MPGEIIDKTKQSVVVHIDRTRYEAPSQQLTGGGIRHLPSPPVADDRDLWLEVPGGADRPVADDDVVDLKNGMHFFTAPRTINPG